MCLRLPSGLLPVFFAAPSVSLLGRLCAFYSIFISVLPGGGSAYPRPSGLLLFSFLSFFSLWRSSLSDGYGFGVGVGGSGRSGCSGHSVSGF